MNPEEKSLRDGILALKLTLDDQKINQLMAYLALLQKWNKAYNLSAIRDLNAMVDLHLLDSLAVVPHVTGTRLADVGTGAGLPGIPLALVFPDKQFILIDSAGKKTRFLTQVVQELKLNNVQVENVRVESWQPSVQIDMVISRAFASLADMSQKCEHLLYGDGCFLAMKGQYPANELREIEKNYIVCESHTLDIPGSDAQRCVVKIQPRQQTLSEHAHSAVQP